MKKAFAVSDDFIQKESQIWEDGFQEYEHFYMSHHSAKLLFKQVVSFYTSTHNVCEYPFYLTSLEYYFLLKYLLI